VERLKSESPETIRFPLTESKSYIHWGQWKSRSTQKRAIATNSRGGLSFERAVDFDFDTAIYVEDDRKDYGEKRIRSLGMLDGRLHALD
jgi:uncharacterized DUF497 family protein